MSKFWISWYDTRPGEWELPRPWWISGYRCSDEAATICAAVIADDEDDAKQVILECHDNHPGDLEWRFVTEESDDWDPYCDRFQKAEWMDWPESLRREA